MKKIKFYSVQYIFLSPKTISAFLLCRQQILPVVNYSFLRRHFIFMKEKTFTKYILKCILFYPVSHVTLWLLAPRTMRHCYSKTKGICHWLLANLNFIWEFDRSKYQVIYDKATLAFPVATISIFIWCQFPCKWHRFIHKLEWNQTQFWLCTLNCSPN